MHLSAAAVSIDLQKRSQAQFLSAACVIFDVSALNLHVCRPGDQCEICSLPDCDWRRNSDGSLQVERNQLIFRTISFFNEFDLALDFINYSLKLFNDKKKPDCV